VPARWPTTRALVSILLLAPVVPCRPATGDLSPASTIRLPGAPEPSPELAERLRAARAATPPAAVRTRHRLETGEPRYVNRLILETSPYLLQHAHNPVDWYPWGEEAFAAARRLGRPILLSIGYSTCHWCHVMEEESFEDEEIAEVLNANYVAIKVDREERPDLDAVYMSAVELLTGRGGWPMTTWLTPEGRPFFGGTYFPARDGDRGTATGFLTLLRRMKRLYDEEPQTIADRAGQITERIRAESAPAAGADAPAAAALREAVRSARESFDAEHGGRAGAPKFPSSFPIRLLLREHRRTGDAEALRMATVTLDAMARGGIHDQVGGGFHRYATDARWLVPHFEKMLYDNALLAITYLEAHQVTGREDYAQVVRDVLRWVAREMTSREGAFYSALDADSLDPAGKRQEGWYYTWTPEELRAALGEAVAPGIAARYGVGAPGNFEGRSVLHLAGPPGVAELSRSPDLERAREVLYRARCLRPAPLLDDKVLAGWNGLMISALARSGFALDDPDLLQSAVRAAEFVLGRMIADGRLLRSYRAGRVSQGAYLEDHAFLIAALLDLYESTGEPRWLARAIDLQSSLDQDFRDEVGGGYFTSGEGHETLIARDKPYYDGAIPSGNSVALLNLVRLAGLTTDDRYRRSAAELRRAFAGVIGRAPAAVSDMLLALEFELAGPQEVVVVSPGALAEAGALLDVVRRTFLPATVRSLVGAPADARAHAALVPLVEGKVARDGRPTAYLCRQGVCRLPTTDPDVLRTMLASSPTAAPAQSD
jgi:uncharacterized protein YyaL (SSP411 family)